MMAELEKQDVYACALPMPTPDDPKPAEWSEEIGRQVERSSNDEVYLVGHSLGVPALLRYLETLSDNHPVRGIILVSGPAYAVGREHVDRFFAKPFNFELIKSRIPKMAVIQGDDDPLVPREQADFLANSLGAELLIIPNGGHLNGSSGWRSLPQALEVLNRMMEG